MKYRGYTIIVDHKAGDYDVYGPDSDDDYKLSCYDLDKAKKWIDRDIKNTPRIRFSL